MGNEHPFNTGYRLGYGDGAHDAHRKTIFWKSIAVMESAWIALTIVYIIWKATLP